MAYKASVVSVGTTAAELFTSGPAPAYDVLVYSTVALYVGPTSSVTTSTGYLVPATSTVQIPATGAENDSLYGIAATSGTAYVLQIQ
jgi:hypothetical protein